MRKLIAKNDIILIFVLLILALSVWLMFSLKFDENIIAVIENNGKIVEEIDLNNITEETMFSIEGNDEILVSIKTQNGKIRFESAQCSDLVCVRTGWLSKAGQTAVCLPARISIYIKGGEKTIDAVTE